MLGVAVDAAAGVEAERLLDGELEAGPGAEVGPRPPGAAGIGMVVDVGVAGGAGASRTDTNGWTWQARQLLASAAWPVDRLPLSHIRSP